MTNARFVARLLMCLSTLGLTSSIATAELTPDEVVILTANGRESQALANYYATKRGISTSHICSIDFPNSEELSRSDWQESIRPKVTAWLNQQPFKDQIRCIATTWGVPLRIGKGAPNEYQSIKAFYDKATDTRLKRFREIVANVSGNAEIDEDASVGELTKQLESAMRNVQSELANIEDVGERRAKALEVRLVAREVSGLPSILSGLANAVQQNPSSVKARSEFDFLRGRANAYAESRQVVELGQLPSIARDRVSLQLIGRLNGLRGALSWLQEQQGALERNESESSFDSELSLVLWPEYETLRWQNNFLHKNYAGYEYNETLRTLMVSRIDAPTLKLAKGLVDGALKAEANGLKGKSYFDARGLVKDDSLVQPGSTESYDRSLALAANQLKERQIEVVLDEEAELFAPGQCPEAALYCGWYSLAKYVDAFDWSPGSIGYHIAGAEAISLKNNKSQAWCKRMLEDGVCATIGPVAEPYTQAFPLPHEFFGLITEGELTLVECFYQTKPFNSWMLTLIGDPLYRPFGKHATTAPK